MEKNKPVLPLPHDSKRIGEFLFRSVSGLYGEVVPEYWSLLEELSTTYKVPVAKVHDLSEKGEKTAPMPIKVQWVDGVHFGEDLEELAQLPAHIKAAGRLLCKNLFGYVGGKAATRGDLFSDIYEPSQYVFDEAAQAFVLVDADAFLIRCGQEGSDDELSFRLEELTKFAAALCETEQDLSGVIEDAGGVFAAIHAGYGAEVFAEDREIGAFYADYPATVRSYAPPALRNAPDQS